MSTVIDVANAVVTKLNAGEFSQAFEAVRHYRPTFDLGELETLHVSVVPESLTIKAVTRQESHFDCAIDIGVQKKVDVDDQAALDALMNLVEELADALRQQSLDDPQAACLSIANSPLYAQEHLDQWRQFTSVLTVTYRVWR